MTPKELETEALQLNPAARARLAKKLLNSLDVLSEAEVERLWVEEAERRNEQIERGVVEARRAEDVIRDARSLRVVHNQDHPLGLRVSPLQHALDPPGPILSRAPLGRLHMVAAGQWLHLQEDLRDPVGMIVARKWGIEARFSRFGGA